MTDMLFLSILNVSFSCGLIVIVLILFSSFLDKRYAAKWKCLIWIFIAVRLLLPFNTETVRYAVNFITKNVYTVQHDAVASGEGKETAAPRRLVIELPSTISTPIASQDVDDQVLTPIDIMKFIWLTGTLGFLGVHIGSYLYYKKQLIKHSVPVKNIAQNRYIFKQMANNTSSGRIEMVKQEDNLITRVRLMESTDDVWCIFYAYPEDAIEGAGARIPVIIDTFAVTP